MEGNEAVLRGGCLLPGKPEEEEVFLRVGGVNDLGFTELLEWAGGACCCDGLLLLLLRASN